MSHCISFGFGASVLHYSQWNIRQRYAIFFMDRPLLYVTGKQGTQNPFTKLLLKKCPWNNKTT